MDLGFGNWPTIQALRNPTRPAFIDADTGKTTSFVQLEERTNRLADALHARGVRRGDRVAMVTLNSPMVMEIYFAVAKLGAISVPINFRLSTSEINFVLQDSGATVVFASSTLAATVDAAREGTFVRETIVVPVSAQRRVGEGLDHDRLVAGGDPARVVRDISHDDLAVLMYTSGTTGRPKGAMLTHGNFQWNAFHAFGFGRGLGREDVTVSAAPLFHIGALGIHTMPLAYIGGCTVIMEAFTPEGWLDVVERYRTTVAFLVPAMWAAVAQSPTVAQRDLESLKFAVSGGAPCPVVVMTALKDLGMEFTEGFGMTETAPIAACLAPEDTIDHAGSIGRPVAHVDFRLVDAEGHEVGTNTVGELTMRGPNVFVGYWGLPQASAEALRGGWFHTGDMGRVDEDGYYTLVDRKQDLIITGGENVYPIEVEQVIYQHPDVTEVAVVGAPDETWGETVIAVVVTRSESTLTADELLTFTRERIAHFKAPRRVEFVEALPRNATGKVLKRALRQTYGGTSIVVSR